MTAGCDMMSALTLNFPATSAINGANRRIFLHGAYRWPLSATVSGHRDKPSEKNIDGSES